MRVLVTGVKGQLGYDVMNELKKQGLTGIGVDVDEMDITDAEACRRVITEAKPDAVIHCAAYTAVDAAEQNMELCRKVNAGGTRNIAEVCKGLDIKMPVNYTSAPIMYLTVRAPARGSRMTTGNHSTPTVSRSMRASWQSRSW